MTQFHTQSFPMIELMVKVCIKTCFLFIKPYKPPRCCLKGSGCFNAQLTLLVNSTDVFFLHGEEMDKLSRCFQNLIKLL